MITDPVAETRTELTHSPPLCFTSTAFSAFNDGVFYTKIGGGEHIRFHISLKISLQPKPAAEYK